MTKVKICGNVNLEDARLARELGADFLGFIFAESKRRVSLEQARAIREGLSEFDSFVGVFFNQPREEVLQIAESLGLRWLQFHGDETALYCRYFEERGFRVIKTFRIKDAMSLKRMDDYNVTAFLFDTFSRREKGGTGETFDWNIIEDRPYVHDQLFLAGGLNPDNLRQAIDCVRPFAVDVASGVESAPGRKDPEKLRAFIEVAHGRVKDHERR